LKLLSPTSDNVYSITKAYALKGTLLSRASIEPLTEARDLEDLVTRLKATAYSDAVSKIQPPHAAYKIDLAAREHVASLHYDLLKVYSKPEILSAYFMKYVVGDLKAVLKGKAVGRSYEEIQRYLDMYAEELIGRRDLVARALAAESLDEAVNVLKGAEFFDAVESAVKTYKETQKLDAFDVYLDRALYQGILKAFVKNGRISAYATRNKRLRPIIAIDIDSYNVLSILRAKSWDLPQPQTRALLVEPTFDVPQKTLNVMIAAANAPEAIKFLSATPYRTIIPQTTEGDMTFLSALEEAFRRLGYEMAVYPFLWESFTEGVVLSLIRLKELEARNISAIAFGIEHSLGSKAIMQKIALA
jgi:V/A-type H+-transporting ATPase subunit C